jgi:hypothetical protein
VTRPTRTTKDNAAGLKAAVSFPAAPAKAKLDTVTVSPQIIRVVQRIAEQPLGSGVYY